MSLHRRFRLCFAASVVSVFAPLARAQPASPPPATTPGAAAPAGEPGPAEAPPQTSPPPLPPGGPSEAPPGGPPGPYYAESPGAAPSIYVAQPPLPPLQPRNRYYHDGFYLRLSGGYSFLHVSTSLRDNDSTSSLNGSGTAFDIMIGGTPAPGLVIGGGLLLQQAFDPGTSVRLRNGNVRGLDAGANGTVGLGMIGPMIDAFPVPTGGFHFGGLLGLAEVGLEDNQDNLSGGFGLSIWTGYMWWVSSQWSLGIEARYSAAFTTRKIGVESAQFDAHDTSQGFALMFSAAYH
ncbi:MAG TPA: hypothetical protein VH062_25755 [Polyangiaceae bacterium]|nr:hypothetical protein [Polyangiaceae bacterium]